VQGSQSSAGSVRVHSEQLPTESQVFEDEALAGAKRADDPPRRCRSDTIMARILSELSNSVPVFRKVIRFADVRFGETVCPGKADMFSRR